MKKFISSGVWKKKKKEKKAREVKIDSSLSPKKSNESLQKSNRSSIRIRCSKTPIKFHAKLLYSCLRGGWVTSLKVDFFSIVSAWDRDRRCSRAQRVAEVQAASERQWCNSISGRTRDRRDTIARKPFAFYANEIQRDGGRGFELLEEMIPLLHPPLAAAKIISTYVN